MAEASCLLRADCSNLWSYLSHGEMEDSWDLYERSHADLYDVHLAFPNAE